MTQIIAQAGREASYIRQRADDAVRAERARLLKQLLARTHYIKSVDMSMVSEGDIEEIFK